MVQYTGWKERGLQRWKDACWAEIHKQKGYENTKQILVGFAPLDAKGVWADQSKASVVCSPVDPPTEPFSKIQDVSDEGD